MMVSVYKTVEIVLNEICNIFLGTQALFRLIKRVNW